MIIYVDIDGTICNITNGNYKKAKPKFEHIQKINKFFDKGHTIIYWTARGALSKVDWTELTKLQLEFRRSPHSP